MLNKDQPLDERVKKRVLEIAAQYWELREAQVTEWVESETGGGEKDLVGAGSPGTERASDPGQQSELVRLRDKAIGHLEKELPHSTTQGGGGWSSWLDRDLIFLDGQIPPGTAQEMVIALGAELDQLPQEFTFRFRLGQSLFVLPRPIQLSDDVLIETVVDDVSLGHLVLRGRLHARFDPMDLTFSGWSWGESHILAPVVGLLLSIGLLENDFTRERDPEDTGCPQAGEEPALHISDSKGDLVLSVGQNDRDSIPRRTPLLRFVNDCLITPWDLIHEARGVVKFSADRETATANEYLHDKFSNLQGIMESELPDRARVLRSAAWLTRSLVSQDRTDRVIYLSTGFEALLGDPSKKSGITERLSDRLAYLLGPPEDRSQIAEVFENTYDLRSRILHKGELAIPKSDYSECVSEATGLLMQAIEKEASRS